MSERRIVQISAHADGHGSRDRIVALADDGTLWEGYWESSTARLVWHRLPSLPPIDDYNADLQQLRDSRDKALEAVRQAISLTSELYTGSDTAKGMQTLWNCQKANEILRAAIGE